MKTTRKSHSTTALALALAGLMAAGALSTPTPLRAQAASPADAASQKIQIMVQAIDAQGAHDYVKARELYAQLLAMDPTNADLKTKVADMDAAIKDQSAGKATAYDQAPATSTTSADTVAVKQLPADTTAAAAPAAAPAASTTPAKPGLFARLGNAIGLGAKSTTPATADSVALKAQEAKQNEAAAQAGAAISKAKDLIAAGSYDDARTLLEQTSAALPQGLAFNPIRDEIKNETAQSWFQQAVSDYKTNQNTAAQSALNNYIAIAGNTSSSDSLEKALGNASKDPWRQDINVISPNFESKQDKIGQLLVSGRAQYLYGDNQGALDTFNLVLINDPENMEAKAYATIINTKLSDGSALNQKVTRSEMLREVNDEWVRPKVYKTGDVGDTTKGPLDPQIKKMQGIIIPNVNIDVPTPLDQVAATLKVLSEQYDTSTPATGVNIKVYAPTGSPMPKVTLPNLSNLSLDKLLTIACKDSGYAYTSEDTVISLRPGGSGGATGEFETQAFALSEGTRTRLLGFTGSSGGDSSSTSSNPFDAGATSGNSAASATPAADSTPPPSDIEDRLQSFFVRAGIDFPAGSKLAFAAGKIYVTNTPHNLSALSSFLYKYNEVKQVEIEARFLDVTQGKLQEAGTRWNVSRASNPNDSLGTYQNGQNGPTANNLRALGDSFPLGNSGAQPTQIVGLSTAAGVALPPLTIQQAIPSLPNSINVGTNSSDMFSGVLGILDGYKVQFILDMLDQQQGADLMSAPHITVLSQKDAKITVAQVLRYPQTFTSIQSQVSPANGNSNGGSSGAGGVTITAGTPQDFVDEQIGVVMDVIPTVEEDDSITMHLEPKVTEFEGFIEYGGTSIAIQSGTTATVPSGFIQPIFDVRHIMTDVTIFDGATVVMGGLTRDEVKTVEDKVPVLGDIPLLGRLFRSKGESSEKRNLMIFVSANLISPGGSPSNQSLPGMPKGTVFSTPTIVTPTGSVQRVPEHPLGAPATAEASQ